MENVVEISRVSLLGQGVGSDVDGNIYFVPRALPGDLVKVRVVKQDKKYFECELLEVIKASPERVDPPCDYFQQCGGCDWLHWNYQDQLNGKQKMIQHAMERNTLTPQNILPILGAKHPLHYRNRIQLRMGGGQIGFYKKKSHDIVDIKKCEIAQPQINQAIEKIRESGVLDSEIIQKVEIYLNNRGEVKQLTNSAHGADGFRQINEEQNSVLQQCVANHVKQAKAKKVLELFCGNGNLTFSYLDHVKQVIAIDSNEAAIAQARLRKEGLSVERAAAAAFFCDSVNRAISRKLPTEFKEQYDTLIVDPPRSGLAGVMNHLIHQQLKTIIYVSCSVQSFSQDVQCLKKHFQFEQLQPIDMFPQTRHIEFVAKFSRLSF
jgi:23S rRNA (uracil1939-C5)-methyltransferase